MHVFSIWAFTFGDGGYLVLLCLCCVVALWQHETFYFTSTRLHEFIKAVYIGGAIGFASVYVAIPGICFIHALPMCTKYMM